MALAFGLQEESAINLLYCNLRMPLPTNVTFILIVSLHSTWSIFLWQECRLFTNLRYECRHFTNLTYECRHFTNLRQFAVRPIMQDYHSSHKSALQCANELAKQIPWISFQPLHFRQNIVEIPECLDTEPCGSTRKSQIESTQASGAQVHVQAL